jgi:hypothetical protein
MEWNGVLKKWVQITNFSKGWAVKATSETCPRVPQKSPAVCGSKTETCRVSREVVRIQQTLPPPQLFGGADLLWDDLGYWNVDPSIRKCHPKGRLNHIFRHCWYFHETKIRTLISQMRLLMLCFLAALILHQLLSITNASISIPWILEILSDLPAPELVSSAELARLLGGAMKLEMGRQRARETLKYQVETWFLSALTKGWKSWFFFENLGAQHYTGWWFGTFFVFFHILGMIIPTHEVHHFSEG